jgi:hypothetical protein
MQAISLGETLQKEVIFLFQLVLSNGIKLCAMHMTEMFLLWTSACG